MQDFLQQQFVTHAMNGEEVLRLAAVVSQLFPQLHNHLVESAGRSVIVVAPNFVQQPVAGQHFTRMGKEKLEQFELLGTEFVARSAAFDLKGLGINDRGADLKWVFKTAFV